METTSHDAKPTPGPTPFSERTRGPVQDARSIPVATTNKKVKRTPANVIKAIDLMYGTRFFNEFHAVMPGLIDALALVAKVQKASAGEVVFRQGDQAEDCYAIMSGEVGVFVSQRAQLSPRHIPGSQLEKKSFFPVLSKDDDGKTCWQRLSEAAVTFYEKHRKYLPAPPLRGKSRKVAPPITAAAKAQARKDKAKEDLELAENKALVEAPVISNGLKRHLTLEGHNTYNADSKIGKVQLKLGPNDVFGELGLLQHHPRAATIKCLRECTFLVIAREDFHHMFGGPVPKAKLSLFAKHVPGFAEWAGHNGLETEMVNGRRVVKLRKHPCDAWTGFDVEPGHCFCEEGKIAEPQLVVIEHGEVAYHKQSHEFPRKSPLKATNCWETPVRPKRRDLIPQEPEHVDLVDTIWHRLGGAGQMFCTLGVFDLPCAEPFSVIASDNCRYYILKGEDLQELPESILTAIRYRMVDTIRPLLWQSPGFNSCCALPHWMVPPPIQLDTEPPQLVDVDSDEEILT